MSNGDGFPNIPFLDPRGIHAGGCGAADWGQGEDHAPGIPDLSGVTSRFVLHCAFCYGARVIIDHDESISGVVTAIKFGHSMSAAIYEISYFSNGEARTPWIEEFRLSDAPQQKER